MKKYILISVMFLFSVIAWGQRSNSTYKPIVNVGFQQGTHSMLQLGAEYDVMSSRDKWLFVGGGVLATPYYKEWHWLPYVDVTRSYGLTFYGARTSTKHIQPQVGITLLNVMDIGVGYSIPYSNNEVPVIKGFNFNLKIRLSGNDAVYPKLKIGF